MHTNEEIEWFVNMYIFCDISLLLNPLQNAKQHQHTHTCKEKKMLFIKKIIHYFPCMIFFLEPFQIDGNYPFLQQYLHT